MKLFPEIRTKKYLLRQFSISDLENVYKGLSNNEVIKYYGISFETLEAAKDQISWFEELEKNETGIWWAICSEDNKSFYGACGFSNLDKNHKKAEIGFWLLPEFWRKGIISEAFQEICHYGFEKLDLHRIEAQVEIENIACKNLMRKFNFKLDGILRECEIKNNNYISLEIYSKLRADS